MNEKLSDHLIGMNNNAASSSSTLNLSSYVNSSLPGSNSSANTGGEFYGSSSELEAKPSVLVLKNSVNKRRGETFVGARAISLELNVNDSSCESNLDTVSNKHANVNSNTEHNDSDLDFLTNDVNDDDGEEEEEEDNDGDEELTGSYCPSGVMQSLADEDCYKYEHHVININSGMCLF